MSYIIDTDWVINILEGREGANELYDRIAPQSVSISIITYGEVLEGMYRRTGDGLIRISQLENFVRQITLLPIDEAIARRYARERSRLRAIGMLIPDNDLWIAASALVHDFTLVTRDQHFERVAELRVFSP